MEFLKSLIELLIRKLRKDKNYRLDPNYRLRELFLIIYYRALQMVRGLRIKCFIKSEGIVFCGRDVSIEHGYHINSGPSLILEDNVHINALSVNGVQFGRNVSVGKGTIIVCTGVIANKGIGLRIGNHTGISAKSYLGCQGGITIGSDVIIGPGLKMFSENHNFEGSDLPIRLQGENRKGIDIGDNCWLGSNVTILDGVTVGAGCVIAAGSIVSKSMPPDSIVAGIPAKVLKSRLGNETTLPV
jgi:acetyltransferase-like isoleucine patch superfamily enzyme